MQATLRQVRNTAADLGHLVPPFTQRERERYLEILKESPRLLLQHPRSTLTFSLVAGSVRCAPATLRRYFADLDDLIGAILHTSLLNIAEHFAKIPRGPDRARECRKLYFNLTRSPSGSLSPIQLLMARDRHSLPQDLHDPIDMMRHGLGVTMAGELAEDALSYFENANHSLEDIEAILPALAQSRAAQALQYQLPPPAPEPEPERELEPALELETELKQEPEPDQEIPAPAFITAEPHPPAEPPAEQEPFDPWETPPSANDVFFAALGIQPRSRAPPK